MEVATTSINFTGGWFFTRKGIRWLRAASTQPIWQKIFRFYTPCIRPRWNFAKMFSTVKTRTIMLKEVRWYVKQFRYNTGMSQMDRQTDRQTDRIAISILRVSDNYWVCRPSLQESIGYVTSSAVISCMIDSYCMDGDRGAICRL